MKRFKEIHPNEFKVGIFILVPIIILLLFIIVKLGYSLSGSTIDVYLKVDNISSLKKGTSIKLKGYDIGKVVDLSPVYEPALHFLATMRIKKNIDLHEDCSAIIMNQNIIGDTVIELRNTENKGKPLLEGDVIEGLEYVNIEKLLQEVSTLIVSTTGTVNVIKQLSKESRSNIREMLANLRSSTGTLNNVLQKSQGDILATVKSFRDTSRILNEISKELKKRPMGFIFRGKKDDKKNME